jgi:competence protein ComEC
MILYLEKILLNKFYLLLIFLAYGIAIGLKNKINFFYSLILLIISIFFYFLGKFYYKNSNIKEDLKRIAGAKSKNHSIALLLLLVTFISFALALGNFAASTRLSLLNNNQLKEEKRGIILIGQVKEFDVTEKGLRLYLDNNYQLENGQWVKLNLGLIRVNIRKGLEIDSLIGEWVRLKLDLLPPPGRAFPNSFSLADYTLFKGIGALGYSFYQATILEDFEKETFWLDKWDLKKLRKTLVNKIKTSMSEPAAGITSAMLLGENAQIGSDDYYAIRVAGLAHIIAISGMHVVVVVAIAFFLSKFFLLYFIPFLTRFDLALYLPIPKISALLAILLSTFYVFLAGAPISAQRALITSSLVMLCLVFDKRLDPIRSLVLVAIILLLIRPESLFSAGLQMSFAACFALITSFKLSENFLAKLPFQYLVKLMIASVSATLGVAPFILYHFNQFTPYGLIANLICVPLSDFIIMPLGLLALLLMPFGLEKFALIPVEISLNFMLALAKKISFLPYADLYFPSLTPLGLIIVSMGFLFFCLVSEMKFRITGLVIAFIGFNFLEDYSKIQILLSSKSFAIRQKLIANSDKEEFIFSSRRRDFFLHELWMSKIGRENFSNKSLNGLVKVKKNAIKNCNEKVCFFTLGDSIKGLIYNSEEIFSPNFCKDLNLFINIKSDAVCPGIQSINSSDLKKVHLIKFDKKVIVEAVK